MRMLKKIVIGLVIIAFLIVSGRFFWWTTENYRAKNWSGTAYIKLKPNQKLINVTWKDESVWYLYRKMRNDEVAETYYFEEKTPLGVMSGGMVEITETKN